jgi:hypothetical protein
VGSRMTKGARRWLLSLLEGRICDTCGNGIVSPEMFPWSGECGRCRVARVDREDMMGGP